MDWIDAELALTAVAAMLSPTTLSFSVLALVLGERPLRTGVWFYLGALGATLAVGVLAAFVLGNQAAAQKLPMTSIAGGNSTNSPLLLVSATRQSGPNLPAMSTPWRDTSSSSSLIGTCSHQIVV